MAALLAVTTLASCNNGGGRPQSNGDDSNASAAETTGETTPPATLKLEDQEAIKEIEVDLPKLENPEVKLLACFDLNPAAGKPKGVALEMFETKCGGKIVSDVCTWDSRYDKLSTLVLSGDAPDMFSAEDFDIVPKGIISGKFQAMDKYIDYNSELWAPVKDINDQFMLNGKHYVGLTSTDVGTVIIYNKRTIENNNLPDPAELLAEDNWNWDTFYDMMIKFSDNLEGKVGYDCWEFEHAFAASSGTPWIGLENGRLVSNLESEPITRVEEYFTKFQKNGVRHAADSEDAANVGLGKTLFFGKGVYVLTEPKNVGNFGEMEDIMFVPMPKCPYTDDYYLQAVVKGFAIPTGAKNPEGTAAYLNCVMICRDNETVKEIEKNQLFEDYGWTQEMYDMLLKTRELTVAHPMFDYFKAVNDSVEDFINGNVKDPCFYDKFSWSQLLESIKYGVQSELDEANKKLSDEAGLAAAAKEAAETTTAAETEAPTIETTAEVNESKPVAGSVYADFSKGSSSDFEISNGWCNGDPFNVTWRNSNVTFEDGKMQLIINKDKTATKVPYAGGEYRSLGFYGYGLYEVSMKAIKNDGVVSSFFTYTGPSDNQPWDEIDIEILGKDTTKVQFNYYRDSRGGHEYMYDLGFDASEDFHTYGFEWAEHSITWYVDGKEVYKVEGKPIEDPKPDDKYKVDARLPEYQSKIMANAWCGIGVDGWLKAFDDSNIPLTAEYQWMRYTPLES